MKFPIGPGKRSPVIYLPLEATTIFWLLASCVTVLWVPKSSPSILNSTFARYGITDEVTWDNSPQFSSSKFKQLENTNTTPKYPQAPGQVDITIVTTKHVLKKACNKGGNDPHINLLESRNTPINGLSYSPAHVFGNRRPTTTQSCWMQQFQQLIA